MPATPYTIRLDDDLRKALEREAALEDRPAAQLAVRAIRSMIEGREAKRAAIEAALSQADEGRFIAEDAMMAWIDTWDTDRETPAPKADPAPARE